MRIKFILLLALGCTFFNSNAQRIYNVGVATIIRQQCPACLDGNDYITAAAATVDSLDFSSLNLFVPVFPVPSNTPIFILDSLTGFYNLKYLNVSNNGLGSMRDLPRGIETFIARNSLYYTVPYIGDSLVHLDMGGSRRLNRVENNILRSEKLKKIILDTCILAAIPGLPSLSHLTRLETLNLTFNNLYELPSLPNNLDTLYIGANYMGYWGALPAFPDSLKWLDCHKNLSLNCLTSLPAGLTAFFSDSSNLDCLPNIPVGISSLLPVCNANNNPDNCAILNVVAEENKNTSFNIFPNPNKGIFTLQLSDNWELKNSYLSVTNHLGQAVFDKNIQNHTEHIELNHLTAGVYWLTITQQHNVLSKKIIIE